MSFNVIILIICMALRVGNAFLGENVHQQESLERSQRIYRQRNQKAGLDNFKMNRRETFVVTPEFEMKNLALRNNGLKPVIRQTEAPAYSENVRYDIDDGDGYKHDIHDEASTVSDTVEKDKSLSYEIIYRNHTYDADTTHLPDNSKEAMMAVVSKQNAMINELVDLYKKEVNKKEFQELLNTVNERRYNKCLSDSKKNKRSAEDLREGKENNENNDNDNVLNKNKSKETVTIKNKESNEDTKTDKPKEENEKKDKDNDVTKNKSEENVTDKIEDTEKDIPKANNKPVELKNNGVNENNDNKKLAFISIDENEVKKKLLESPLVRRILSKVEKKKQEYINRRRQEIELEDNWK